MESIVYRCQIEDMYCFFTLETAIKNATRTIFSNNNSNPILECLTYIFENKNLDEDLMENVGIKQFLKNKSNKKIKTKKAN